MKNNGIDKKRLGLVCALIAGLVISAVVGCTFLEKTDKKEEKQQVSSALDKPPQQRLEVVFEEPYPPEVPVSEKKIKKPVAEKPELKIPILPKVAIIIDDMGYHRDVCKKLLALDLNLTFSFLPHAPYTTELEQEAYQLGRDILLHQPMEPRDTSWDIGPGGIFLKTGLDKIAPVVEENLDKVPYAIGVNNHMGSKYTEDVAHMQAFLSVVKKRELFFVDSFTTSKSVGMMEAAKMGIETARRHVFLDNIHNPGKICHKLEQLVARAQEQGSAIGIGHPNKETLTALSNCQEKLRQEIQLVGVHELVGKNGELKTNR